MESNPYKSPHTPPERVSKSRFRLVADVVALSFAFSPCLLFIGYRVIDNVIIRNNLEAVGVFTWVIILLWSISAALHVWGAVERRPVSVVGLLVNFFGLLWFISQFAP